MRTHKMDAPAVAPATAGSKAKHTKALIVSQDASITLTITASEARIDSRLLAQGFGNKHKSVMNLIERYGDRLKSLGILPFKKAVIKGRGQPERYALLNEDQAYFLLSLSRNSSIVVDLKGRMVKAFGEARRARDMRQTDYMTVYHALHDQIKGMDLDQRAEQLLHLNVNKALNKFAGVAAGQRAKAPATKQALMIVGQMVIATALKQERDPRAGYQRAKVDLQALGTLTMLEVSP